MFENIDFDDRVLDEIEHVVDQNKTEKLGRSKAVKAWLKFYAEWFNIVDINLTSAHIIGEQAPGAKLLLVPEGVTYSTLFEIMKAKGVLKTNIENPDVEIKKGRNKNGTYVSYDKYNVTLLEELLLEALAFQQTGEFLPYGHRIVGSSYVRSTYQPGGDIYVASEGKDRKRIGLNIYILKRR